MLAKSAASLTHEKGDKHQWGCGMSVIASFVLETEADLKGKTHLERQVIVMLATSEASARKGDMHPVSL